MFRLLLIFTAVLTVAKPAISAETTRDQSRTASERSFLMGLTPMNFDDTPDGPARMKAALAENADVVAIYLDWGYLEREVKRHPEAAGLAALAMNLGLHDRQAQPRPALDQWQTWNRKPRPIQRRSKGNE